MEAGIKESAGAVELSEADLRAAREGLARMLRMKRVHPQWREANSEELLAKALQEYSRWMVRNGGPAERPVAWLINCAWQRGKDLFDYESRRQPGVSIDADVIAELADHKTPSPEEIAINHDTGEQLRRAMAFLDSKDRRLLSLVYFEDYTIKDAGRRLGWLPARAERHHKKAMDLLHSMLDGKVEAPAMEIGLAAWISVYLGQGWLHLPGLIDPLREAAFAAMDYVRRALPFSDPASATLASGGTRAAGICGVAVLACVAGVTAAPEAAHILSSPPEKPASKTRAIAPPTTLTAAAAGDSSPVERHRTQISPQGARGEKTHASMSRKATQAEGRTPSASAREKPASHSVAEEAITEFGNSNEAAPSPAPSPAPVVSGTPIGAGSAGTSAPSAGTTASPKSPSQPASPASGGSEFGF